MSDPAAPIPGTGYLPSGDIVKQNLLSNDVAAEHIDSILWLLNYGRSERLGSISALAKKLNVNSSTVGRLFSGKYEADLASICSKIDHFREVYEARKDFGDIPVVRDLLVARDIADFCDLTRATATMSVLFGPNQSGKSWALKRIYTPSNNHGQTIYVSMLESGGATRLFIEHLAKACGISQSGNHSDLKRRIFRYFDPQTLLIVDEFHQTLIGRTIKMTSIELIRAIYEHCGCGIVLCGTDIVPDMFEDRRFKKFLGQTANRGALRRMIPATPYPEDVRALCRAYGFGPATGEAKKLVDEIASTNGIGKLCKFMQMAKRLAAKRQTPVSWDHFLATKATLASWEKGERMKRD